MVFVLKAPHLSCSVSQPHHTGYVLSFALIDSFDTLFSRWVVILVSNYSTSHICGWFGAKTVPKILTDKGNSRIIQSNFWHFSNKNTHPRLFCKFLHHWFKKHAMTKSYVYVVDMHFINLNTAIVSVFLAIIYFELQNSWPQFHYMGVVWPHFRIDTKNLWRHES